MPLVLLLLYSVLNMFRMLIQDEAERTPLFEKRINSKPKKIGKCFSISGKNTEFRHTSTCFEQNITQVAALNIDTLM